MSFDPKVWTQGSPARPGMYFVAHATYTDKPGQTVRVEWLVEHERLGMINGVAPLYRSILPVPSAAEHAALVECELVLRDIVQEHDDQKEMYAAHGGYGKTPETEEVKVARAALARLDAARKERGA